MAIASGNLIPMDTAIKETIEYTRTRFAFGQPLLNNQYIHFRLSELQTELELFRAMVYTAGDMMEKGEDITLLASMLKLKVGRLARVITDSCLQFWGGMGYSDEVYVSRLFRDLRLDSIAGGGDETMLSIICNQMGILPKRK